VAAYEIRYDEDAVRELEAMRPFDQGRILDSIDQDLATMPATASRRRKKLLGLRPPWSQLGPVWQLRVGDFRVFYDVDEVEHRVTVKAIRRKGRQTTEDIYEGHRTPGGPRGLEHVRPASAAGRVAHHQARQAGSHADRRRG
jgi:mRNA-degrading endonuclease RelE of RelBE toxin-antitoxin system